MTTLIDIWKSMDPARRPDKGWPQGYMYPYSLLLERYHTQPVTICELGVAGGKSMEMWDRYFTHPDTKIYGIDMDLSQYPLEMRKVLTNRVTLIDGDSLNLDKVGLNETTFDFVLDDGNHGVDTQTAFFKFFCPRLKPGGLLMIEDIHSKENLLELINLHPKNFYLDTRNVNRWAHCPTHQQIKDDSVTMVYVNEDMPDMWPNYEKTRPGTFNVDSVFEDQ